MNSEAIRKHFIAMIAFIWLTGCATYKTKYLESGQIADIENNKEVSHTFYLIGDAGLSPVNGMNPVLKMFKNRLKTASSNSTAIFLGDNIYPAGMPDKKDDPAAYLEAKSHLDAQLHTLEDFKGNPFFIPGNHDWYSNGLAGLKREQKYIQKKLKAKDVFYPLNGCPISTITISDDLAVVVIDTEWYLTNWNKHTNINDHCEIKSRDKFLEELEGTIKKNSDKTVIIAMHHPMFTYGPHGGQFSLKQQLYPHPKIGPLPLLGSFINVLRKTTGASIADVQNKRYGELRKKVVTLAQYSDRVILASGHEHALQYIVENNTPQIVSGSGAKKGVTRLLNGSKFSTGHMGYATLEVYTDGSSRVRFFGLDDNNNETFLYTAEVLPPKEKELKNTYKNSFPKEVSASIYAPEEVNKSKLFKGLWGERYRKYYGMKVTAPVVDLDTLFGGLTPIRKGGGHQSKSLRLRDKNGKEYVMRSLRKVAELYLQAIVFQDQYLLEDLADSYLKEILLDFYTGSHPYAPFAVGPLSDAIGIYHTNPALYYVPKQAALLNFNQNFGDELYMIEEHAGNKHGIASFGFSEKLKSTNKMLANLRDDERYQVDAPMYLRARLFDMVLGDWDRHTDQWRWAEFKEKKTKKITYRPVPRDRDQVFSNMGDGLLMGLATRVIPELRIMEGFKDEIRSVKGFNSSPKTYVLDLALLNEMSKEQWQREAQYIQQHLTEAVVDKAFEAFPKEVRDETIVQIKRRLLSRVADITRVADEYFSIINKYTIVKGTDKDDRFEIVYKDRAVTVIGNRIKKGQIGQQFYQNTFYDKDTKEIWIYGLDDTDEFIVKGEKTSRIKVRLIGGKNNDSYAVEGGGKIHIYDYLSKKNSFEKASNAKVHLTDNYEVNTYQPLKFRRSTKRIIPTIGFNPDDGVKIGLSNTYIFNGFRKNPFTQKHGLAGSFYFATGGFDIGYQGEFAAVYGDANLEIDARLTSPNFAINFFGFGNETKNVDDDLGLDYNRVRYANIKVAPYLVWRGDLGSKFKMGVLMESIDVEKTNNRFINTFYQQSGAETNKYFMGVDGAYSYQNIDNKAFPTMGMQTTLQFGYKTEITNGNARFAYVIPSLAFDYKLVSDGSLVLATKWKAHFNLGNDYEFYQGASIGGVDGLRGYRNQRFTGKKSYYQNTDLRFSLGDVETGVLPAKYGVYAGFDYGRVWLLNDSSKQWHTSYGAGAFFNVVDMISMRAALFHSDDGARFAFGFGFAF